MAAEKAKRERDEAQLYSVELQRRLDDFACQLSMATARIEMEVAVCTFSLICTRFVHTSVTLYGA